MEIFKISKENMEVIKEKAKVVGGLAIDSAMKQIGDEGTMSLSLGIGLIHGFVCGSAKRGVKAGLVTLGVCAGANVVKNIARNWDEIKNQ